MKKLSDKNTGRLMVAATAVFWGLAGVCVKSIDWSPLSLVAARSVLSLLVLFLFKKGWHLEWNRTNVLGGAMVALTGILYVAAIKLTTAGTAIVLQYVAPILVYLYGVVFRRQKVRMWELLIVAAVFFGCVLSFSDQLDPSHVAGNLLALLSGVTFAAEIIVTNGAESNVEDSMIISNILAFAVTFPFVFFDSRLTFDAKNLLWVLALGVVQYGLANVCYSRGIQKVSALEGSLILTIEPIFNPIPVWIFCQERMGVRAIVGSVVVILFVTLYGVLSRKMPAEAAK